MEVKADKIAGRDINIFKRLKNIGAHFSFWVGFGLIFLILLLSLFLPCPTASQFQFFRIALAIGLASFAGSLPGFLKLAPNVVVKVGTGLAVFAICYFTNPATIILKDDCYSKKLISGKVFYEGSPLAHVKVEIGQLNEWDITNGAGEFDIPYSETPVLPLDINFQFKGLDTLWQLNNLPDSGLLLINLLDTVPELNREQLKILIKAYIQDFESKIEAEHTREMYRQKGRASSLKEISTLYGFFDKIDSRYRNFISFTNGFNKLSTQKSIRASDIRIDPMVPYGAYELENHTAFIYKDSVWNESDDLAIDLSFALFNNFQPEFEIVEIDRKHHLEYRVKVKTIRNIRYVRTKVHCSKSNHRSKYQESDYMGMRPNEVYIFRYLDGRWQLFDIVNY